jgi:hypothetical protein
MPLSNIKPKQNKKNIKTILLTSAVNLWKAHEASHWPTFLEDQKTPRIKSPEVLLKTHSSFHYLPNNQHVSQILAQF